MSYRHSSYRKLSAAVKKATAAHIDGGSGEHPGTAFGLTRSEMDRILHWSMSPPLPKSREWGNRRHKCRQCGKRMAWIDCPTGGWWAHDVHPADDHDAVRRAA